jgi:hypothetical protein
MSECSRGYEYRHVGADRFQRARRFFAVPMTGMGQIEENETEGVRFPPEQVHRLLAVFSRNHLVPARLGRFRRHLPADELAPVCFLLICGRPEPRKKQSIISGLKTHKPHCIFEVFSPWLQINTETSVRMALEPLEAAEAGGPVSAAPACPASQAAQTGREACVRPCVEAGGTNGRRSDTPI